MQLPEGLDIPDPPSYDASNAPTFRSVRHRYLKKKTLRIKSLSVSHHLNSLRATRIRL